MRIKTIHRLVIKSYLGPLILTFCIVTFVLMMNFLWRYIDELTGKGLGADVIIELLFYATINLIPMGLPLAMLFAGIMTLGNLGENYELLAMKSAGMSLFRILKPLIILVFFLSIGSFFVVNNLVPYANKKMNSILYNINNQKQVLKLHDGLFFNGIDEDISIRAEHQDPVTNLLTNVLIYDNSSSGGNMTTTVAESGYIRLSDDKKFLLITLYNGENYQYARNSNWYTKSSLRHDSFKVQEAKIPMEGFNFENTDNSDMFNGSQTKNIVELQHAIDSLDLRVTEASSKSYEPLMKDNIFTKDIQVLQLPDSLMIDKSDFRNADMLDSLSKLDIRKRHQIWTSARSSAINSRNSLTFDESSAKIALTQLYRSKNDWHNKLALPVSVFIFFLIGAPLGAIIRKGGLGTPIVISVAFFVFYYIISLNGKKAAEEGLWSSFTGMWLSSFVLTPIAVYLLIKATNDSSLLDTDWYYNRYIAFKERFNIIWLPVKSRISSWGIWKKLGSIKFRKAKKIRIMRGKDLRIVFMGTPEFAVASLRRLVEDGYNVVAVVTTPDKPAGRGQKIHESDVKVAARELGLPILQPEKLKSEEFVAAMRELNPDLGIVIAFRMLPEVIWAMPRLGTFNLHASLLPQYRGAAPINWAIMNGEKESGITTFLLNHEIDKGAIIGQQRMPILPEDNVGTLYDKLMMAGCDLVVETVEKIAEGNYTAIEQMHYDESSLKPAPKIFKEDCRIDWSWEGERIVNFVRGLSPYPAAWGALSRDGEEVGSAKIFEVSFESKTASHAIGTILSDGKESIEVVCGNGIIHIHSMQMAGKRRMTNKELLLGLRDIEEYRFE